MAGITDVTFINAQPLDIAAGLTQIGLEKAKTQVASVLEDIQK
jgi:hypothetical protein